ncbi:hypothetical protein CANDROIZ_190015 [Candidatus Roizmanbacteria bacterium]|nr:hypothetical protein CANDROIZ_190015 [Candidatus Roizmanbacteria bacterium]
MKSINTISCPIDYVYLSIGLDKQFNFVYSKEYEQISYL